MTAILLLHGPNLNLLGTREPAVYGSMTLEDINRRLIDAGAERGVEVRPFQSNHEGALVDTLHEARAWADGVVFNPGAYTHTSVAIGDALALAAARLQKADDTLAKQRQQQKRAYQIESKVIILLSDGENNAGKNQHGNAVTNAFLGNLFA